MEQNQPQITSGYEEILRTDVCNSCGFELYLHTHHIKRQSDHPELRKLDINKIVLCKFCHQRVHSKSNGGRLRIMNNQIRLIEDLHRIAPKQFNQNYHINWALIEQLQSMMIVEQELYARCIDCNAIIGYKNNAVIRFLCDTCRDK